MKDGSLKEGKVRIDYNLNDDQLIIEGSQERISAKEISTINFETGQILYVKEVSYYSKKTYSDIKKSAFFSLVLDGSANLYKYKGQGFLFMIEINNQNFALQKLKINNTSSLNGFIGVLMYNIVECIDQQEIFDSKLKENRILYLINKFNNCKDPDYIPLKEAEKKHDIKSFGFSLGQHSSSLDLSVPIYSFEISDRGLRIRNIGEVNTKGSSSTSFEANFYYINNFGNSEKWLLFINYGYRGYDFELTSEGRTATNLISSETSLTIGPSYRLFIGKKSFIQLALGPHLWFKSGLKRDNVIYSESDQKFLIVSSGTLKKYGFGVDLSIDYTLKMGKMAEFFVGTKFFLRNGENRITENYERGLFAIPTSVYSDELTNQFSVFGGYRFVINKDGFF